jgi:hypothetical protein
MMHKDETAVKPEKQRGAKKISPTGSPNVQDAGTP